ncbi:MAG: LLM class F420-dependent oxidoreductase [Polyangiaceae bacterium UTPRO1]|jgi:probable F420-dependent oxidoreductase|nr:TIGR03619 family F420-dependent LLM class oxidoreductase [Myxococcales bacterium]OQY66150.1 MAG: LLM class F420-dependent oxidoreductase [Polyangiaceae bacterium UTPRO1]
MRFSYAEAMCAPAHYLPLARAAEDAGYTSFTIADSICYPQRSDSVYPYTPDGGREFLEDKPFIEPFVLMSALAAVTSKLRFTTFVLKLPIRDPVLVAKQAASLAVMSGNRLVLGVGTSPWPEDFLVTGTDWKTRGARLNEMIQIIRGLTRGGYFEHHGKHYDVPSIKICPAPTEPIKILIGGHSEAALKRAARNDGWMHAGGDQAQLEGYLRRLYALRREYGREREPFEIHAISFDGFTVDGVRRLADLGVTDVIVGFRNMYAADTTPLQKKVDALRLYAEHVIAGSAAA